MFVVQEKAVEALEIFDELVESDISVIVPHLKTILEFCLNVSHINYNHPPSSMIGQIIMLKW